MLILFGIFFLFVMWLAFAFFWVGNYDDTKLKYNYKSFLRRHFPLTTLGSLFVIAALLIYPYYYFEDSKIAGTEIYFSYHIYIFVFLYSFIFWFIFKSIYYKELNRTIYLISEEEIKKQNPYLIISFKVFIIAAACLAGIEFTHLSNYAFDSSEPKVEQRKIIDKKIKKSEGNSTAEGHWVHYDYELFIDPPFLTEKMLYTNQNFYESLNIGDKIKIFYKDGLYGCKHYSMNYELVH